jgi:hypothetical protein
MDPKTLEYYDRQAAEVAAKFRAMDQTAWRQLFREAFPVGNASARVPPSKGPPV